MLGRLIQGYSRGSLLESATDETHTRTLLWPELHPDGRPSSVSPPTTPFGSPNLRISPFDDRVGLELNETKDLRLVVAQDAFGTNDRPLVLYDSQTAEPNPASETAPPQKPASPPPAWGPGNRPERGIPIVGHARNRSSTISGASASWGRPNKDLEVTDHLSNVLDCMFGVSSATKTGSSTKIHLLPGDRGAPRELGPRTSSSNAASTVPPRAPLLRSRTATHGVNTYRQHVAPRETEGEPRDAVLITQMFSVNLPEAREHFKQHRSSSDGPVDSGSPMTPTQGQPDAQGVQGKKPKLVEKKTPVFAVGLLCYLPRSSDMRVSSSSARPSSRASYTTSSAPNSYGSDSFSWTFLNAIPEHLLSPETSGQLIDKSIEIIVKNWDVVLRSLAVIEALARIEIGELLQEVNLAMVSSAAKAPKGPSEQRTNQRNVYLRSPNALVRVSHLQRAIKHTLWRVSYALRVPRVLTGFGLDSGGHWLDEARYLVRVCGNKQQNFFLFNLLTAFLGNHTEWLERLGPDWYRKQFRALNKKKTRPGCLAGRTVIICDNRSTARRIIFLLASFLPRSYAVSQPAKVGTEFMSPLLTPDISSSSPVGRVITEASTRRHARGRSRDGPITFSRRDIPGLSTSVSSTDSASGIGKAVQGSSRSVFSRSDHEEGRSRHPSIFSPPEIPGPIHKTNATSSTATPSTGTPVPHFSTRNDCYFPEGVVVDGEDSGASADLARILRRDSASHAQAPQPSINWGSLISNVSGLWGKKQDSSSAPTNEGTTPHSTGSLRDRRKLAPRSMPIQGRRPRHLERMVDEASDLQKTALVADKNEEPSTAWRQSVAGSEAQPPRLRVDDKDGVVDVDIGLPGFIGWADGRSCSPPSSPHHRSSSFVSSDEAESSYSSRSHRGDGLGTKTTNVAGFLKRYHEDFILQGVKPYPELQDEVEQSMSREITPIEDFCSLLPEEEVNGERWVNVCTTLLADLRNFTIQRLTLSRRVDQDLSGDLHNVAGSTPRDWGSSKRSGTSQYSKVPVFSRNQPERFTREIVMDFDTTLTDAIERILSETEQARQKSGTPSRTHSRTVSTGTTASAKSEPLEISGPGKMRDWGRPSTLSQSDCRQAVVGALEEVVKSVNDDLAKHHRVRDADGHAKIDGKALSQEMKQENVLREGVKKWLLSVETRSVW
ncbi:uncharacterized protein Z518_10825 [Rhinocladiella mackenziei CBS 650.93]|uniref:Folliculin-interacting protein N-terminal domain-containing protein n=1 Tax=Rhinocladiella mackenziei CBS 650.93 TaxID=1442369 RepID=A0A0D2GNE7_9EURO|nr:uncharacterized protein Z518_10825 [Rhinocladiella mackenziei CBS 650.93]KIW99897.1 hypothetical protein Z518_10825 [Rhinocladiella mackenziei CBS 650.93]